MRKLAQINLAVLQDVARRRAASLLFRRYRGLSRTSKKIIVKRSRLRCNTNLCFRELGDDAREITSLFRCKLQDGKIYTISRL